MLLLSSAIATDIYRNSSCTDGRMSLHCGQQSTAYKTSLATNFNLKQTCLYGRTNEKGIWAHKESRLLK